MSDPGDFIIKNGVLTKYIGPGGDVMIPDSVTSIGDRAFYYCHSLTSVTIPKSVTSIGGEAFSNCESLTSVTIAESVTSIGDYAFYGCSKLTSVTIPNSVTSIGNSAFSHCSCLTSVTIAEGVTSIGNSAFYGCSGLKSVTIPKSVTGIGDHVFSNSGLQLVSAPVPLTSRTTGKCSFGVRFSGEKPRYVAYAAKWDCDNLQDFARAGNWSQYDRELINNGPKYRYKPSAQLLGALGRLLDPEELTEENRVLYADLLNKNAKKLIPLTEELGDAEMLQNLLSLNILDEETLKVLQKRMSASAVPEIAVLAAAEFKAVPAEAKEKMAAPAASPLQAEFAEKLKAIEGDAVLKKMRLIGCVMPKVKLADGTEAPEELFRFLLASYGAQMGEEPRFAPEADAAAKLLSYDSLCEAMEAVSGHLGVLSYPAVLPLLCRYGNARQIRALTDAWKDWGDWARFGQKGRKTQEVLACAMPLSDTRDAVVWLEKNRDLKVYASLRGVTVDEVYEKAFFDLGFDESGKRMFDLGTAQIQVTLTESLQLDLLNTTTGKAVKSIPKKGVDPDVQKKAADELADLRQNMKNAVKIKNDQLFKAYLAATTFPAESWKRSYLKNPFLYRVAELLVWDQAGRCFRLTDEGPIDSDGQPYTIGDAAIKVAHPKEMKPKEVTAWQKHFTARELKQPFAQIWEPVIKPKDVKEDRYKDCMIPYYRFTRQEKHGIRVEDHDFHNDIFIFFADCNAAVERIDWRRHDIDVKDRFEVKSFKFRKYNRQVNHIVAYLDRITVWDRVRKDDVSVMEQMDRFTLAQITEFIKVAQEAQAVNVLALMMEYKNAHFADFNPMDEFTLEW